MQHFFQLDAVQNKIEVLFRQPDLLLQAFVHRSFWNENQELVPHHNERLEFLGDSILGLLVAEYLFVHHPELDEGSLSKLRSQLVDAPACAHYVQQLGISEFLLLGKGEQLNEGKGRDTILSDLFEALMGALYLDQGVEAVRTFFLSHFKEAIDHLVHEPYRNWKAELQDWAQKNFQQTPVYTILEESGPAHQKRFRVGVWVQDVQQGEGEGSSKKEAQTAAAQAALLKIEGETL
ncbi:MAG: Ribonuclease 3 [Chlamydiales bacterium]|nr:Ribonuclease 3 [Chlamydiales bacterium]